MLKKTEAQKSSLTSVFNANKKRKKALLSRYFYDPREKNT